MKVVSKLQDDLVFCLDSLDRIISGRIRSNQKKSDFSFSRFKTKAFENSLDRILQLPSPLLFDEKIILLLAIFPYVKPGFLDDILAREIPEGGKFKVLGGITGKKHFGFIPTGETALFILAGTHPSLRQKYQKMLIEETNSKVLSLIKILPDSDGKLTMRGRLVPDPDWLEKVLTPLKSAPAFPVQKLSTSLQWEDLVLPPETREKINEIENYLNRRGKFLKDPKSAGKEKSGYRALFHGPSGTGKTLTAALLGKKFNFKVYRIDLSRVVSKYIGETEKNLRKLFSDARDNDWILLFDEADALFGKRTSVKDSHDRYANQEVSYLLQQIENFEGLLIMAANLKSNLDEAFIRRFNNSIHFPTPGPGERLKLWVKKVPDKLIAKNIDWNSIAEKHELTGAQIAKAVKYAGRKAHSRKADKLLAEDIDEGINKQLRTQHRNFGNGAGDKKTEKNN